jgi:nucleosome binding factor SPN SPT16 subunit
VWLLGYEFPETLLAVCASGKILLLSSAKKAAILESLKAKDTDDRLVILTRSKDAEIMKGIWETVVEMLGDNIGVFPKDVFEGKFYDEYKKFVKAEQTDVTLPISLILAAKDESELVCARVLMI